MQNHETLRDFVCLNFSSQHSTTLPAFQTSRPPLHVTQDTIQTHVFAPTTPTLSPGNPQPPPSTLITPDTLARHSTKVATTQTPSPNAPHHSLRHALTRTDSTIFPTTHKPSPITPRHSPRFAPTRPPLHDTPLKLSRHTCPRPAPRHSPPTRSRPPFDRNALARHSALAHPRSGL